MLFNSSTFVVFVAITFAAYWATPSLRFRNVVLLVASLVFYAFWDVRFLALVFYVTAVAYASARALHAWPTRGKAIVAASVVLQLGQLAFFKYTNFFLSSVTTLAQAFGATVRTPHFDIILPVGVSFYTFHGISYVVDTYRGKIKNLHGPIVVALYVVFFPQLVAGPIVRANVFLPQIERLARLDTRDVIVGLKLATIGLIYKGVFADSLAPFVDSVFRAPHQFDNASVWKAAFGFYAQIYFDFAGYSVMAIGISRLFGYKFPKNFDFPYRSTSITEFWRRWHISLSTWLRDYLYIPLGGNRHGTWMQYRNLFLTMLLGGLWHGASFNFVVWGALHGAGLAGHKLLSTRFPAGKSVVRAAVGLVATQAFVFALWIPFRARSFADARTVFEALCFAHRAGYLRAASVPPTLLFVPILVDHLLVQNPRLGAFPWPRRAVFSLAVLGVSLSLVLPLLQLKIQNFIYFQF